MFLSATFPVSGQRSRLTSRHMLHISRGSEIVCNLRSNGIRRSWIQLIYSSQSTDLHTPPLVSSNQLLKMVNFKALSTSIVLSFALAAVGTPVARDSFLTAPISYKSSNSISAILAKDNARFPKDAANAVYSGTVTNEDDTYVAAVTVGTQVVSFALTMFPNRMLIVFLVWADRRHWLIKHLGWCGNETHWWNLYRQNRRGILWIRLILGNGVHRQWWVHTYCMPWELEY